MNAVKQISTGKILYSSIPNFEIGVGFKNAAVFNPEIPVTDMIEIELTLDELSAPTYDARRRARYSELGVTADAMIVAVWERDVEGRPESANALQAIRQQVKAEIPKPV